jgi:hypothetical protein
MVFNRHSPDSGGFEARIAPLTRLGNDKSCSVRPKGDRSLRLIALKRADLAGSRHTFAVVACHTRPSARHAGAGGARSPAISDRMSANISRDTAISASWKVT